MIAMNKAMNSAFVKKCKTSFNNFVGFTYNVRIFREGWFVGRKDDRHYCMDCYFNNSRFCHPPFLGGRSFSLRWYVVGSRVYCYRSRKEANRQITTERIHQPADFFFASSYFHPTTIEGKCSFNVIFHCLLVRIPCVVFTSIFYEFRSSSWYWFRLSAYYCICKLWKSAFCRFWWTWKPIVSHFPSHQLIRLVSMLVFIIMTVKLW